MLLAHGDPFDLGDRWLDARSLRGQAPAHLVTLLLHSELGEELVDVEHTLSEVQTDGQTRGQNRHNGVGLS